MANKKKSGPPPAPADASPPRASSLIICRNKHWRYISCFHGPWLQLPPEILESLAHQNYTMPAPCLIDPAVLYDIVQIRKAVDEASQDSVRASNGISNTSMSARVDHYGAGGAPGSQLSKERIFKIRQKAVKLLSKAFALDEVAASVATMQATSTLEDVGQHVLKREPNNIDAKYVHFFHEKIPSRAMEHYTPLDPLDEIISSLPLEHRMAPLRTRALVQMFKKQWERAVADLTMALRITQELKRTHKPIRQELELASKMRDDDEAWAKAYRDWRHMPHLKDEDQPKSLEQQLLFDRAGAYLSIACHNVHAALDKPGECPAADEEAERNSTDARAQEKRLEARKMVKTYAKRALKDYVAFLSYFDYTPGLPYEITNEIIARVYNLAKDSKLPTVMPKNRLMELISEEEEVDDDSEEMVRDSAIVKQRESRPKLFERGEDGLPRLPSPKIHPVSALFADKPPADLPVFPSAKTVQAMLNNDPVHKDLGSREAVTYHPLLTDALHSVLLAHALLQTSATELLRHAHNAARIARIAEGYPIFQSSRSPSRADWIEVLRRANNWLGLSVSWQKLCAPAPLPNEGGGLAKEAAMVGIGKRRGEKEETAEQKRERIKQESIIDALSDDRVVDEASFHRAVRARERRALEDEQGISGPLKDKGPPSPPEASAASPSAQTPRAGPPRGGARPPAPKRWAEDESGVDYLISTDRAEAVARWVNEAPPSTGSSGGGGKKKRPARKRKKQPGATANGTAADLSHLHVGDEEDEDDAGPD